MSFLFCKVEISVIQGYIIALVIEPATPFHFPGSSSFKTQSIPFVCDWSHAGKAEMKTKERFFDMPFTYDLNIPDTLGISSASSFSVSYSVTGETIDAPLLLFSVSQGNNMKAILSHGSDKENKAFDTYVLPKGYSNSIGFLASGLDTTRLSEADGTLTVTVNWNGWLAQWFDSGEIFNCFVEAYQVDSTESFRWKNLLSASAFPEEYTDFLASILTSEYGSTLGGYVSWLNQISTDCRATMETDEFFQDSLYTAGIASLTGMFAPVDSLIPGTDISIGTGDLSFTVLRNTDDSSAFAHYKDNFFGYGWKSSLDNGIQSKEAGQLTVCLPDGQAFSFTHQNGAWKCDEDGVQLEQTGNGYILTTQKLSFKYSLDGRFLYMEDAEGNRITATWKSAQDVLSLKDYNNRNDKLLTGLTGPDGEALSFTYDSSRHITSITSSTGAKRTYAYDANGNLVSVSDENGLILGSYEYDPKLVHNIVSAVDDEGGKTLLSYDKYGRLTSFSTPEQETCTLDYRGTQITLSDGRQTSKSTYSVGGDLLISEDSRGQKTYYMYDSNGKVLSVKSNGKLVIFRYDSEGRCTGINDELNNNWSYSYSTYNGEDRKTETDPHGNTTLYSYDTNGRITSIYRRELSTITSIKYDENGNVTEIGGTGSFSWKYEYDDDGNLVKMVQGVTNKYTFSYDSEGRIISSTAPDGGNCGYEYDDEGRMTTFTDANGNATTYSYDERGNLTGISYASGGKESFAYDAAGNLLSWTNMRGETLNYTVDANGDTVSMHIGGTDYTYQYDQYGDVISAGDMTLSYNADGSISTLQYADGRIVSYAYDKLGRIVSVTDECGNISKFAYDAYGNLDTVKDKDDNLIADYDCDQFDRVVRMTGGNGTSTTWTYNQAGQVEQITYFDKEGRQTGFCLYAYDYYGRCESKTTESGVWTFKYAYDGKLLSEKYTPSEPAEGSASGTAIANTYTYDLMGNRLSKTNQYGEDVRKTTYSYNNMNQIVSCTTETTVDGETSTGTFNYRYDADGNLLEDEERIYTWTKDNRVASETLKSTNQTWTYGYDAFGNRSSVTTNGVTTRYTLDVNGNVLAEYVDGVQTRNYNYGLSLLGFSIGGEDYYFNSDMHGSTIAVTDGDGNSANSYFYDTFGNVLSSTEGVANDFEFAGGCGLMANDSGTIFVRARNYDPETGRWISMDPSGLSGGDNLYVYCGNSPATSIDITGETPLILGLAGGIIGAIGNGALYAVTSAIRGDFTAGGLVGSMVTGGIAGGVIGATGGVGLLSGAALGAGASAIGDVVAQVIDNRGFSNYDWGRTATETVIGGIAGGLLGGAKGKLPRYTPNQLSKALFGKSAAAKMMKTAVKDNLLENLGVILFRDSIRAEELGDGSLDAPDADKGHTYAFNLGEDDFSNLTFSFKQTLTPTAGNMLGSTMGPQYDPTVHYTVYGFIGGQAIGVVAAGTACSNGRAETVTISGTLSAEECCLTPGASQSVVFRTHCEMYTANGSWKKEDLAGVTLGQVTVNEVYHASEDDPSGPVSAAANICAAENNEDEQVLYDNLQKTCKNKYGDDQLPGGSIRGFVDLMHSANPNACISVNWAQDNDSNHALSSAEMTRARNISVDKLQGFVDENGPAVLSLLTADGKNHSVTVYACVANEDGTGSIMFTDSNDGEKGYVVKDTYVDSAGKTHLLNYGGGDQWVTNMACTISMTDYKSSASNFQPYTANNADTTVSGEETLQFSSLYDGHSLTCKSGGVVSDIIISDSSCLILNEGGTAKDVYLHGKGSKAEVSANSCLAGTITVEGQLTADSPMDAGNATINMNICKKTSSYLYTYPAVFHSRSGSAEEGGGNVEEDEGFCFIKNGSYLDGVGFSLTLNASNQETGTYHLISGMDDPEFELAVYSNTDCWNDGTLIRCGDPSLVIGNTLLRLRYDKGDIYADVKHISSGWIQNFAATGLECSFDPVAGVDYYTVQYSENREFTDAVSITVTDSKFSLEGISENPLYCRVCFEDSLDWSSGVLSVSEKATGDIIAPTVSGIAASTTEPTNQDVIVTAVFEDNAEVALSLYKLDDGAWTDYPENGVTVRDNCTVYFKAVDTAGNESAEASIKVENIDKTPPEKPTATADVTTPTTGSVNVSAVFSEDSVKREYSLDSGNTWQAYIAPIAFTANRTVYFRGIDAAGNASGTATFSVTNIETSVPDTTPPTIAISADTTAPAQSVTVSAVFSDDAGVATRQYRIGDGEWTPYTEPVTMTENERIFFRAVDTSGNETTESYTVTNIETSVPGNETDNAPDNGKNNTLYNKKTKTWNKQENIDEFVVNNVPAGNSEVRLDKAGTVDDGKGRHNFLGRIGTDEDASDYAKIKLSNSAALSFSIDSTIAGTFYVYQATKDKKGNLVATQRQKISVKANTVSPAKKTTIYLEAGEYYVGMETKLPAAKKGNVAGYYNVNINSTRFFESDNGWNNHAFRLDDAGKEIKTDLNPELKNSALVFERDVTTIKLDSEVMREDGYENWVGFGDAADYKMITLKNAVNLTLDLTATGKAKLTIWKATTNAKTGAISLSSKGSVSVKPGKTGSIKSKFLDAGTYFVSVTASDAAKGGDVYYNVAVGDNTLFFDSADSGANNELYNKKSKVFYGEDGEHHFETTNIGGGTRAVRLDSAPVGDTNYENFVGYQDAADYAKIVLTSDGSLRFALKATGDATFTVYRKGWDKKGKATLDVLQTTKLTVAKDKDIVETATDVLTGLTTGEYYVSMTAKSTKANASGSVFYSVMATLDPSASALAMPETSDSLDMTDSLSFGGYDADVLADASASSLAELNDQSAWRNLTLA